MQWKCDKCGHKHSGEICPNCEFINQLTAQENRMKQIGLSGAGWDFHFEQIKESK